MQTEQKPTYQDVGHGPAVVLLHDFPLTADIWQKQIAPLKEAGFRVILPDFSKCHVHSCISDYSRKIIELLNRLGLGRVAVCGMGMGGAILFDLLERAQDRFAGACFIATRPVSDDIQERARRGELIADLLQDRGQPVHEELLTTLFNGSEKRIPESCQKEVRKMVYSYDRNALIGGLKAMANRKDYTSILKGLRLPTLVLSGEHDSICHPQHVTIMAGQLSRCLGAEKLNAGHLIPFEQPEKLNRRLIDFFRAIAPRRKQHVPQPVADVGGLLLAS